MCKYCEGDEYIVGKNGCASFVWMRIGNDRNLLFNTDANEYDRGEAQINYCPMCGRNLKEAENGNNSL